MAGGSSGRLRQEQLTRWPALVLFVVLSSSLHSVSARSDPTADLHLTTNAQGYLTVIQGFATQLQCVLNSCSKDVQWYKDDVLIFNGTAFQKSSGLKEDAYILEHRVDFDNSKDCTGTCSDVDVSACGPGTTCLDNACCACEKEDFTLVLRNLTFEDSGRYRCQIPNKTELLEFQVDVLESGLKGGFHENISYDHSECCAEKGISRLCRAMCKPAEMHDFHFDPTSCKTDDYKHFLSCATEGGTRSHVHCCKTQLVPSFCYDFCSGDFQMLRRSHRLCLYYLPEIFDCYNRAYLPYPDPPENVIVNALESDMLSVCWTPPKTQKSNAAFPVIDYTVYYKQIPSFPFLGSSPEEGIPLLTGDYGDGLTDDDYGSEGGEPPGIAPSDAAAAVAAAATSGRTKRSIPGYEMVLRNDENEEVEEEDVGVRAEAIRKKRQTWVFVTRDDQGNSSAVREFTFETVNTTETCATLIDLRSATRYIVYVTARNDYGTSVPSVRSIASTNVHQVSSNASLPDSMKCCTDAGVSSYCGGKMCDVRTDPSSFAIISIATTCRHEWPKVSPCVADGRNHTECCVRKGVQSDCLGICSGAPETLGIHSVLCLNLDLAAIYQCLREGYETHPSSPVNVSVRAITQTSAEITWEEPAANSHLVQSYTLFIRKNEHGATVKQIENAISPHIEVGLVPDSSYAVSVRSHSEKGVSLPSTAILFETLPSEERVCTEGEPLYQPNGRPVLCEDGTCPVAYTCTKTDDGDEAFCCPNLPSSSLSFERCCRKMGVSAGCLSTCFHNTTSAFPADSCQADFNSWIRCASDGHDHSRCCEQERLPKGCEAACRHPFQVNEAECIPHAPVLARCFAQHHSRLPAAVRNLQIVSLDATSATIQWEDNEVVDIFEVQLFSDSALVNRTITTTATMRFSGLKKQAEYAARVIAFSSAGSSPPSFNLTFTTPSGDDESGDLPLAPIGVRIAWNRGTSVNVTWQPVTSRQNGEKIADNAVEYTLYYGEIDVQHQWSTVRSNTTWALMRELRRDALYSVYVTAGERAAGHPASDRSSPSSSVITLIAQHDSLGLPEPQISLSPEKTAYALGERITVNCSTTAAAEARFNMDLAAGEKTAANEPGQPFVFLQIETTEHLDAISCAVTDTDGRQNVARKHVRVKYGPTARMEKQRIRAFDDLSAEIVCIVEGFPIPDVHFEFKGARVYGEVKVRSHGVNAFSHTLLIRNVTDKAGEYACVATSEGVVSTGTATLQVSEVLLPVNPRLILDCCEEEGVEGDCLKACNIGEDPRSPMNCSAYAQPLLKCANDLRDHGDCCRERKVPRQCVPLCSGDSFSPDVDCSSHAATIMSCFVRGHESSPTPPRNVNIAMISRGHAKVTWDPTTKQDNLVFYAVYYKKYSDDSDDYKVAKSRDTSVELSGLEPDVGYDVAVTAVNGYGHSPLVFVDLPAVDGEGTGEPSSRSSSDSSSSAFSLLLLFVILVSVFGAIVIYARRHRPAMLPTFLQNPHGVPRNDASVAFENPGYANDIDHEVEIRGLGSVAGSDWQSTELSVAGNGRGGGGGDLAESRGMRYSKLNT